MPLPSPLLQGTRLGPDGGKSLVTDLSSDPFPALFCRGLTNCSKSGSVSERKAAPRSLTAESLAQGMTKHELQIIQGKKLLDQVSRARACACAVVAVVRVLVIRKRGWVARGS